MPEKRFPGGSVVKNLPQYGRHEFTPGSGRSLGKEMATYSSILAWEILCTEQSVGNSPKGHKRVGHNLETSQQQWLKIQIFIFTFIT